MSPTPLLAPPAPTTRAARPKVPRPRWAGLRHRDAVSARLAELDGVRGVLVRAADRVSQGWVQDAWLCWVAADGSLRFSQDSRLDPARRDRPVAGVCLVSALRLSDDRHPVADRAVDVCWHALHGDGTGAGLQPAPDVRLARTRDLTRWNDRPERTATDVTDLYARADLVATAEMARLRTL